MLLMEEAERIAKEEHGSEKILVISGEYLVPHCIGHRFVVATRWSNSQFLLFIFQKGLALGITTERWGMNWMART